MPKVPYNPKVVIVTWGTISLQGFMDGEMVTAARQQNNVEKHVGADGRATLALVADDGADITVTLAQSSPSNDKLTAKIPNASRNYLPTAEFQIEDLNGNTLFHAEIAWIKKVSDIAFGDKVLGRKWMFDCESGDVKPGGEKVG